MFGVKFINGTILFLVKFMVRPNAERSLEN